MNVMLRVKTGNRQRGAVAIIVAICIFILVGMLALVIDLGHLYISKTGLQNGADAAALAGAKELDGTQAGIDRGVAKAIKIAKQNQYSILRENVGTDDDDGGLDIYVGSSPDDADMVQVSPPVPPAAVAASDKTFMKVHTRSRNIPAWFAGIFGIGNTVTFGMAVAGRYVIKITPIAVCAPKTQKNIIDPVTRELSHYGFRYGVGYNVPELNPIGAQGVPMLVNPVDVYPNGCNPNNSSASATSPFICSGNSGVVGGLPARVYVNTGGQAGPTEKALNCRFDEYPGGTACAPTSSPPDINVKRYHCVEDKSVTYDKDAGCITQTEANKLPDPNKLLGLPSGWMDSTNTTTPVRQAIKTKIGSSGRQVPVERTDTPAPVLNDYGALWTYSHAVNGDTGLPFDVTNAEWAKLYNNGANPGTLISGYPTAYDPKLYSYASPYNQGSSSDYFYAGSSGKPTPLRRELYLIIVDCDTLNGGGLSCSDVGVLSIGKFFMTVPASLPGKLYGEFAGLVDPYPSAEIKLYR